jgi:hypothetical protein
LIEARRAGKAWRVAEGSEPRMNTDEHGLDGEGEGILAVGPGGLAGCADRNSNEAA